MRTGQIQRVIVKNLARLSRDLVYLSALIQEMGECGCTILSVSDDIDTGRAYDEEEALRKPITIWDKRERMHEMEDSGRYRFYGEKIDDIPDWNMLIGDLSFRSIWWHAYFAI